MIPSAPEMSLEQFAAERGLKTSDDTFMHINAALRCKPVSKSFDRRWKAQIAELQNEAEITLQMYEAAIDAGEIRRPVITIEERDNGHPDNAATQAAIRLLAKRAAQRAGDTP